MKCRLYTSFLIYFVFGSVLGQTDSISTRTVAQANLPQKKETDQSKISTIVWDGQFAVTTDGRAFYSNFGGPGVRLDISNNFGFGVGMFPSIRYKEREGESFVSTLLGTGVQLYIKQHIVVCMPFYYMMQNGVRRLG